MATLTKLESKLAEVLGLAMAAQDAVQQVRGMLGSEHEALDKKLYRFSPADYQEIVAVFNGPHPETGEDLEVVNEAPAGVPPVDLPSQPAVFAPDYAPEEIAEIARNLRKKAGLGDEPTGVVANNGGGVVEKVKDAVT